MKNEMNDENTKFVDYYIDRSVFTADRITQFTSRRNIPEAIQRCSTTVYTIFNKSP